MGRPAKVIRALTAEERASIAGEAASYVETARKEMKSIHD